jgi:hypothetical protein
MKAVVIYEAGGPKQLIYKEVQHRKSKPAGRLSR